MSCKMITQTRVKLSHYGFLALLQQIPETGVDLGRPRVPSEDKSVLAAEEPVVTETPAGVAITMKVNDHSDVEAYVHNI